MSEQLGASGMDALVTERAARKAAERARGKAQAQLKEAKERAELWELRCKDNGRTARHFRTEFEKYRDLYEQATTNSNIFSD